MIERPEGRSDADLLELSVAGDETAFQLLYERLKTSIFRYAFHMTNSKPAAEEVTQEVFISLLKVGRHYKKAKGDVAAFAFGIARNFVRRVQHRERVYQGLSGDGAVERLSAGERETEELSGQLIRNQRIARVQTAIASLPDHYRQVIVLCDLCEISYAEAAGRLGCAVGTVRSRLNRAHALLAKKIKPSKRPEPELPTSGTEECLI